MNFILKKEKKNLIFYTIFVLVLFLNACQKASDRPHLQNVEVQTEEGNSASQREKAASPPPPPFSPAFISSMAANVEKIDTSKRFIKTANMQFQVKNVLKSSLTIEDIVIKNGGFVLSSNLTSSTRETQTIPKSIDSLLEIKTIVAQNTIQLRVPYRLLDTTLREIARQIQVFDHRVIKAEDVTYHLLEQSLKQKRSQNYVQNQNQSNNPKNADYRQERILEEQITADDALLEKLNELDKIKYSTVDIHIYEAPKISTNVVVNINQTYYGSFWLRCREGFIASWYYFQNILVFLSYCLLPFSLLLGIFLGGEFLWKKRLEKF